MSRYVIANADGYLYSGNAVPETTYQSMPSNPTVAVPRSWIQPLFDTKNVLAAMKYDTQADAAETLVHPDLHHSAKTDFDACKVQEVEHDRNDPQAIRDPV